MDCQRPVRDLSYLRNDDIPIFDRLVRKKPSVDLAKRIKTTGLDEQDVREFVSSVGGPNQIGFSPEQFERFLRMMFGDFEIDPCQLAWPVEFFHIGGALSDFTWYSTVTAHRKLPMVALLAGVSMVGNMIGRKLMSSLGARGVVNTVVMSPSSSGKNRPREVIQELYATAKTSEYLLGEDVTSDSAIADALASHPVQLILWDEFGKALEVANHPNAAGALKQATALVMKLATSAGVQDFMPKKFADKQNDRILHKPHLNILATTTDDALRFITPASMRDGFNSRFLFYNEDGGRPDHRQPEPAEMPEYLIEWVREWAAYRPFPSDIGWEEGPPQRVIELTDDARTAWDLFRLRCDVLGDAYTEDEGASIWGRAAEKASNYALIAAASEHVPSQEFAIEKRHMDWAVALVDWVVNRSLTILENVGRSDRAKDMDALEEFVKSKRRTGASGSEITKRFHKKMKTQYRNELVVDLCAAERLLCVESGGTGGRNKQTFYHCEFAPASFSTK